MTEKTLLANQLISLFRDRTSTVGDLHEILAGKEPRTDLSSEIPDQVIGYAQKAKSLLEKNPIDSTTSIRSLILNDDEFIEASIPERKLHTNINFAITYAQA